MSFFKRKIKKKQTLDSIPIPKGSVILDKQFDHCRESSNERKAGAFFKRFFCIVKSKITVKGVVKLVIFSILIAFIIFFLPKLEFFIIDQFEINTVSGEKIVNIDKEAVLKIVSENKKENFFTFNNQEYEKKILEVDSKIKTVYIKKVLPNKAIIFLEERFPVLTIYTKTNCVLVAEDGYILEIENINNLENSEQNAVSLDQTAQNIVSTNTSTTQAETQENPALTDGFGSILCQNQISRYLTDLVELSDSKIDFEVGSKNNSYLVEGLIKIKQATDLKGFAIEKIVIKDSVAYIILRGEKILNLVIDFDKEIEVQVNRFLAIMEYTPTIVTEYSTVDLRFEKPVLRK